MKDTVFSVLLVSSVVAVILLIAFTAVMTSGQASRQKTIVESCVQHNLYVTDNLIMRCEVMELKK